MGRRFEGKIGMVIRKSRPSSRPQRNKPVHKGLTRMWYADGEVLVEADVLEIECERMFALFNAASIGRLWEVWRSLSCGQSRYMWRNI